MDKVWQLKSKAPSEFFDRFPEYPRGILQLLFNRGIESKDEMEMFLNLNYETGMHDPFLMKDMEKAVERIFKAVEEKEKIIIYGDYDADGVCGSAILHVFLKELGADFEVFIPDRFKDGYGLNMKALEEIVRGEAKLIITVDCGITDYEEVEFTNGKGIDVIITDHHLVPEKIPPAHAIVNAKQKDDKYPFKMLCGAATAFKLVQAAVKFAESKKIREFPEGWEKWFLDLAAIATVADMVPLLDENRIIVKYGLIVLAQTKRTGLRRLLQCAGLKDCRIHVQNGKILGALGIDAESIGFMIAPRLNAASRMDHAATSFELLVTDNKEEAEALAKRLEEHNRKRQGLIVKIMEEAESRIDLSKKIIFTGSRDWSKGVIGLVAGRLSEKYSRPVFIYNQDDEQAKGSIRSIKGFNVVEEMGKCGDIFIEVGGHAMAAGFTIKNELLEKFKECIIRRGEEQLKEEDLIPKIEIDDAIGAEEFSWELYDWLLRLEPYGKENESPVFLMKNLKISQIRLVGKGNNHLKMEFSDAGSKKRIKGIGFRLGPYFTRFKKGDFVDVVFSPQVNEWNGNRELEMKVVDLDLSSDS